MNVNDLILTGFGKEIEKIAFNNPITSGINQSLSKYFSKKNLLLGGLLFGTGTGVGSYTSKKVLDANEGNK